MTQHMDRLQDLATLGNDADTLAKYLQNALAGATELRDQARAASQHKEARPEDTSRIARWGEMLNSVMSTIQDQADQVDIKFRAYVRENGNA